MIVKTIPIKIETEIRIYETEKHIGWKFELGDVAYGDFFDKTETDCLTTETQKLLVKQAVNCLNRVLESRLHLSLDLHNIPHNRGSKETREGRGKDDRAL
jgi:hypothetical protein